MRQRTQLGDTAPVASASDALNFIANISEAANRFAEHDSGKRRDFLRWILQKAEWKGGELRVSFKTPFQELRLSNSVTTCNPNSLQPNWALDQFRGQAAGPKVVKHSWENTF
jgi:hypothetical protein